MAKISIRVPDAYLEKIDQRASELGLSRPALILRSVLDATTRDERRLVQIERRLDRVEAALFVA